MKHLFVLAAFFMIAMVMNRLPTGHFVAGGDFYQLLQPAQHFDRYLYAWWNQIGQGTLNTAFLAYPFYSLLALLDRLGMDSSTISGSILFLFFSLSYLGFYYSANLFFPNAKPYILMGGALVYSLNNFTLSIFTYPWGVTHHFLFYIFLPPLAFLYLKILMTEKNFGRYVIVFTLVFLFSTVSYVNPAFLGLFIMIQFFLLIAAILLKYVKPNRGLLAKLSIFPAIYGLLLAPFILAYYLANFNITRVQGSTVMGNLKGWIGITSSNFLNTFFLNMDNQRFPLTETGFAGFMAILLSTGYLGVIAFLVLQKRKFPEYFRSFHLFLPIFLILAFLSIRASIPFREMGFYIYLSPLFKFFRSPDKIFTAIPFIYTGALVCLLHSVDLKKKVVAVLLGILLATPFAFYNGRAYDILAREKEDYHFALAIPREYQKVRDPINNTKRLTSIISLPYSVVNSLNWAQYPEWNFIGVDILHMLYNKFYVSANQYSHILIEKQLPWKNFVMKKGQPKELMRLIQSFSGEFVFYHRDITHDWIRDSKHMNRSLHQLADESKLTLLETNAYFDLYQVAPEYLTPLISSNSKLTFKRINPAKYEVTMNLKNPEKLVFHQSFDPQWSLFLKPYRKIESCTDFYSYVQEQITECRQENRFMEGDEWEYTSQTNAFQRFHEIVENYANSWTLFPSKIESRYNNEFYRKNSDGSLDIRLVIYYKGQSYFYLTLLIQSIILSFGIGCLVLIARRGDKGIQEARNPEIIIKKA